MERCVTPLEESVHGEPVTPHPARDSHREVAASMAALVMLIVVALPVRGEGATCGEEARRGLEIHYDYRRIGGRDPLLSGPGEGQKYDERGWEKVIWTEGYRKKVKWIESEIPDPSLLEGGEDSPADLESIARFMSGRRRVRVERLITRVRAPEWRYTVTDTLIGGRHDIQGRVRYHRRKRSHRFAGSISPSSDGDGSERVPMEEIAGVACRMERSEVRGDHVITRCVARIMGEEWDLLYRVDRGGSLLAGAELEKRATRIEVDRCVPLAEFAVPEPPAGARWRVEGEPGRR